MSDEHDVEVDLAQIEKESDERNARRLKLARREELSRFDARTHGSLEVMPHNDDEMIFRQQGRRVSWGRHKAKYVAARHYPNADCAKQVIDELIRRGCKNTLKEGGEQ